MTQDQTTQQQQPEVELEALKREGAVDVAEDSGTDPEDGHASCSNGRRPKKRQPGQKELEVPVCLAKQR